MQQKADTIFIEEKIASKILRTEIINYEENEMIPLSDIENKFYKK